LSQRLFCERLELALPPGLDDVPRLAQRRVILFF
jgi:hypothetical protein